MTVMRLERHGKTVHINEILDRVTATKKWEDFSKEELQDLVEEVLRYGSEYVASVNKKGGGEITYDDEDAYGYILDQALSRHAESIDGPVLARLVNDVVLCFHEILEDAGLLSYPEVEMH